MIGLRSSLSSFGGEILGAGVTIDFGRAEDCRNVVGILNSLVRIRQEGFFYFLNITDSSHGANSKLFNSIFGIHNYFHLCF